VRPRTVPTAIILLSVLAVLAALAGPAAWSPAHAAIDPEVERNAIAAGDRHYAIHDFEGALAAWRPALDADSSSYELLWRLARATTDRGTRARFDGHKAKAIESFAQGANAARRAVKVNPERAEGHLELAVALGSVALYKGGKAKLQLAREIKVEVDRAIAIDQTLHRAHHVLARWHREISDLSFFERNAARVFGGVPKGATMDAAVARFEKAIGLAPDYTNHHLELGRTFLMLKLKSKARAEFEKALACPVHTPFDADYKAEARILMRKTS
jgi:tetratricopeptide (TPR) repeat protein